MFSTILLSLDIFQEYSFYCFNISFKLQQFSEIFFILFEHVFEIEISFQTYYLY